MTAVDSAVAAVVRGEPVTVAEVDARMAGLRASAFGARLADLHTAEGRNARRWVVQLLCAERLVRAELAERGIEPGRSTAAVRIDRALAVGGVGAAVLAAVPEAARLVDAAVPDDDTVAGYYERNRDRYAERGIPLAAARAAISAELAAVAADRAFSRWLESRLATDVRLAAGYEHPADPAHPDATHRH